MSDWMNQLEAELGSLKPRRSGRDLTVAALCAHRDSQVLTAKRLQRELSARELEAAFDVLEERYPGLLATDANGQASPIAIAFMKTPAEAAVQPTPAPVVVSTSRTWLRNLTMAAALVICFAGGLAIGVGSNGRTSNVNGLAGTSPVESTVNVVDVVPAPPNVVAQSPVVPDGVKPAVYRSPRSKKSSLLDMNEAFYKKRSMTFHGSY